MEAKSLIPSVRPAFIHGVTVPSIGVFSELQLDDKRLAHLCIQLATLVYYLRTLSKLCICAC